MADALRLTNSGIPTQLAEEISHQISAGAGDSRRLMALGLPGLAAAQLARQISAGTGIATSLSVTGIPAAMAVEVSAQINASDPPDPTAPAAPVLTLDGEATTHDSLTWTFTDGADGGAAIMARRVEVYLAADNSLVDTLTAAPWTVSGLTPETGYYGVPRSQNSVGWSASGLPAGGTTEAIPATAPAAPVLSLVGKTADSITVSWPPPADGGSAITDYRLYVGGVLSIASATSPQALVGLDPETGYSITVSALNAVGEGPQSAPLVVTTDAAEVDPEPQALGWGYLADRDEGTGGDWFVAPDGDDGAPGTVGAPFATIQAALDAASGGDVIRVRGGVYRQSFSFAGKAGTAGARTTVARYGAEQVIISGADPVTGWAACTVADAPVVGPNWSHIYKATVPASTFVGGNPRAANPFAGGKRLLLAAAKVTAPQFPQFDEAQDDWLTAAELVTETVGGKTYIRGHRLPALTDQYTQAQIERCDIGYHHGSNRAKRCPVASFDPATGVIAPEVQTDEDAGNTKRNLFVLLNLLPAMRWGQWGWDDNGDGAVTLYVWPHDPADMALVEIAARGEGARVNADHVELRGLIFERQASAGGVSDGLYAVTTGNTSLWTEDAVLDNIQIRDTLRANSGGYAPIYFNLLNDWRATNIQIERAIGQFALFAHGGQYGNAGMADGGVMDRFVIRESEKGPFRLYGQQNARVTRGQVSGCGLAAHANKASNYNSCRNILWWGVDFTGSQGYFTWQDASAIHVGFCAIPAIMSSDGRAIMDQNRSTANSPAKADGVEEIAYLINNACAPFRDNLAASNGVNLGKDFDAFSKYAGYNNIHNGLAGVTDRVVAWEGNHDTTVGATSVYADLARGNIAIREDSPTWAATAHDLTGVIATLRGLHPGFDGFDRDLAGQLFDAANPPVGPLVAPAALPMPPVWIEVPTIQGAPIAGEPLTLTDGYLMGAPYPARTQQWTRSNDGGVTWQPIPGATGPSYTPAEADEGWLIGADLAHSARAALSVPVVNDYPLGTPHLLVLHTVAGVNTSGGIPVATETTPFTSAGKPLLVIASIISANAADATVDLTVGAAGRTFGTGTPLTVGPMFRRTSAQTHVFLLLEPPVGEVTVQMSAINNARCQQLQVYEVEGLTGIGAAAPVQGGTSITRLTLSVTTTAPDSGVLHIISRYDGSTDNAITMTGVGEVLLAANTGGESATLDLMICVGWSRAPVPGVYASDSSWPVAKTVVGRAIELLSGGGGV